MKLIAFVCIVFSFILGAQEIESFIPTLKEKGVTFKELSEKTLCISLHDFQKLLDRYLDKPAESLKREMDKKLSWLPQVTLWGKYGNDKKIYLYQENNISVGKDYVTVGPDEHNTTIGATNHFEVGTKITFDFSKLSSEGTKKAQIIEGYKKAVYFKLDISQRMTEAYLFIAIVTALKKRGVENLSWAINAERERVFVKNILKIDLLQCNGGER